ELEQTLEAALDRATEGQESKQPGRSRSSEDADSDAMPLVTQLVQQGYLRESPKWLSPKGFTGIGSRILADVMTTLKSGDFGSHETKSYGIGSVVLDTSKKYEPGDDLRLLDVPKSLFNASQRIARDGSGLSFPLQLDIEDLEQFETIQD